MKQLAVTLLLTGLIIFTTYPQDTWAQVGEISQLSIQQRYERALNRYEYGDCDGVLLLLAGLTEPGQLDVEDKLLPRTNYTLSVPFKKAMKKEQNKNYEGFCLFNRVTNWTLLSHRLQ